MTAPFKAAGPAVHGTGRPRSRRRSGSSLLRLLKVPALALVMILALTSCVEAAPETAPESAPPTGPLSHNDADVLFAQSIIPHHQRSVEMSELLLAKDGVSPDVTALAGEIRNNQAAEMHTMTGWLEARDQPAESTPDAETAEGKGLLSEDELAELEAAQGPEAARIFLESMSAHHDSVSKMARNEILGGRNEEALTMAHSVYKDRLTQIERMNELLPGL